MKKLTEIKSIESGNTIPEGFMKLKGWEAEKIIEEDFNILSHLERGYYELNNNRYLLLARFDYDSLVFGYGSNLYFGGRVRGVLAVRDRK
jgi:hypothetical protein